MSRIDTKCPTCGNEFISKPKMAKEILEIINYPHEKSIYSNGVFNYYEMRAIYNYIKERRYIYHG